MLAAAKTYFPGPWATSHRKKNKEGEAALKKPSCWRIENVPPGWSEAQLLENLRAINGLGELDSRWLSLFPAYSGNTLTALLNLEVPLQFFQNLDPHQSHSIILHTRSESGDDIEVDLSLDCHFNGLTPLNNPQGDNIIDVIAVTGLAGHAFGSWRNRINYRMWLKDFLPRDLKEDLRILTYGYDSSLTQSKTHGLLEFKRTFIQNLIVARESSMVTMPIAMRNPLENTVRKALLQSQINPRDKQILDSTLALVFFGAPHAGLNVDSLVRMVENTTSSGRQSARLKLLEQLQENSEFLEDQRERLVQMFSTQKLRIVSFYELQKTPTVQQSAAGTWERKGEAVQLIKNISAHLYLPNEHRYSIDGDHTNMVKFMNPTDKNYQILIHHIKECLAEHVALNSQKRLEETRIRSKELQDFLATLKAFVCQPYRDDLLEKRHGQTCQWFFSCEEYRRWMDESSANLLWISGNPGSGKSVLLSYMTKQLENCHRTKDGKDVVVAYFFCDKKLSEQNTATSILRSLLDQVLYQLPSLYKKIPPEYLPETKSTKTWGFGSLWQVFEEVISKNQETEIFCVVDALDECEEESRGRFLGDLARLFGSPHNNSKGVAGSSFRMVISSRPHLPATAGLPGLIEIPLGNNNTSDIQRYVDDEVHKLAQRKNLPNNLELDIRHILVQGAGGMFLWVSLTLYRLGRSAETSVGSIRAQLKELPKDIPAVYAKILGEIDSGLREKAKKVLRWIIFANRPLLIGELKIVLALQPEHQCISLLVYHIENNLEHFLNTIFGPLFKIEDDKIHFVHQSAKDFLTDRELMKKFDPPNNGPGFISEFYNSHTESNLYLAIDCLRYLASEEFGAKPSDDILGYYSRLTDYPFLEYAAMQWPAHAREAGISGKQALLKAFAKLARSDTKFNSAYQIYHEHSKRGEYSSDLKKKIPFKNTPPLQICASLGFPDFMELLLAGGADINTRGGVYGNALMAGIWSNNEQVIKVLLRSPDIDIPITEGVLEGLMPIWSGDPETLELLLKKCGRVTEAMMVAVVRDEKGRGPLELLLERGGKVTERVMQAAARLGYTSKEYLKLLLENGGQISEAVLFIAAGNNFNKALELLLSRGGQVTEAVFTEAVGSDVCKETLERMLNSNDSIPITETILQKAAEYSKGKEGLEFLLERGGFIDEELLMAAAANINSAHSLDFLLKKDPTIPVTEAVLEVAMENSYVRECLSLLLRSGTQVTEAVMVAAARNRNRPKQLFQILLGKGGQITHEVMLAVVGNQHGLEALEFLLGRGGQVNDDVMEKALWSPKVLETLQLLLDGGGQVTEKVMLGAVGYWFSGGRPTVQLLLDHGGQVTKTVMIEAANNQSSDKQTLELLLSRGGQLSEEVMLAAAENERSGSILMELFLSRNGVVTKAVMMAAAKNSKELLKTLLSYGHGAIAAEDVLVEAAGNPNGLEALELLLTTDHIPITEAMLVKAAQGIQAKKHLALLLGRGGQITENVLVAAASNWSRMGALELLLGFDNTVSVTEEVFVAAIGNPIGKEMLVFLLRNGHKINVTQAMLLAAARNSDDREVLKFLLSIDDKILITELVLIEAVKTVRIGTFETEVELLLARGCQVTEAVMVAAAGKSNGSKALLETLVNSNPNIRVTGAMVLKAAGNRDSAEALEFLLNIDDTVAITEEMLLRAVQNPHGNTYLEPLLKRGGSVTEAVVIAAAGNLRDIEALKYLLAKENTIPITEEILLAAVAASGNLGKKAFDLLLQDVALPIGEDVMLANDGGSAAAFEFLLKHAHTTPIAEAIYVRAAWSKQWRKVFELLLDINNTIPITEPVLAAAAENTRGVLEFLFNKAQTPPPITEMILLGAACSWAGKEALEFLHSVKNSIKYTETVLVGAAWNPRGKEVLEFLLEKGGEVTETVMVAAALGPHGKESLGILLERGGQITERVMMAAAWNPGLHKRVTTPLEFLLSNDGKISEWVMFSAALNPRGKENLEFLKSRGFQATGRVIGVVDSNPSEVESVTFLLSIFDEVMRKVLLGVANEFRWPREEAVGRLLSSHFGKRVAVVMLKAAVENEPHGFYNYVPAQLQVPPNLLTGTDEVLAVGEISEISTDIHIYEKPMALRRETKDTTGIGSVTQVVIQLDETAPGALAMSTLALGSGYGKFSSSYSSCLETTETMLKYLLEVL